MEYSQDSFHDDPSTFTIDYLPFDCIVCICEYLAVNDLARFGQTCRFFYEASLVEYLWRSHCLSRWTFCDVQQISSGLHPWRRYFVARRKLEASMERGRPGRDYKVKTLRGNGSAIISADLIVGDQVNWENIHPPLIVSLSQDGCVKVWDILQAKPIWNMDGQGVTAIGVNSTAMELAIGHADGAVSVWDCDKWTKKTVIKTKLHGRIFTLKYGAVKSSKMTSSFLMVHVSGGPGSNDQLEIWGSPTPIGADQAGETPFSSTLLFELWAPAHHCNLLQLSASGLLAIPGRGGDIHVWDLTLPSPTTKPPPLSPHVTVSTQFPVRTLTWSPGGVLATLGATAQNKIELWDIRSKIDAFRNSTFQDNVTIFTSQKEISCDSHLTVMKLMNNMIVVGDGFGQLSVYDVSSKGSERLQTFRDHKGAITDIFTDRFRVLTCSKDFSIRVYCWKRGENEPVLESKYTLLGGSVAHKTHDGFNQLLCESSSCVGVAGDQLKFYTFMSPPLVEEKH